jgi:hypothetical protein
MRLRCGSFARATLVRSAGDFLAVFMVHFASCPNFFAGLPTLGQPAAALDGAHGGTLSGAPAALGTVGAAL